MKKTHQKARKLLDSIGSMINTNRYISELSTSEKQMVEITKALSFDSKLIIMDEPSSSLTDDELKRLGSIIRELKSRGISIIYISHKLDEIFEYCDMITVMRDGHVIDTKPAPQLTRSDMIAMMVGRTIESEYPERPHCVGERLLEVKHLNSKNCITYHLCSIVEKFSGWLAWLAPDVLKLCGRFTAQIISEARKLL